MSGASKISRSTSVFESLESRSLLSAVYHAIEMPVPAGVALPAVAAKAVQPAVQIQSGTGLTGEYFSGDNFQQAVLVRVDPSINLASGRRPDPTLAKGAFSVRWTGQIQPLFSETYTFSTRTTDGVRLWVNGQLLIDSWVVQSRASNTATIALVAGQKVDIRMDYFFNGAGKPLAQLSWSSASQKSKIIQAAALFPDATVALPASSGLLGEYFKGRNFDQELMTRNDPNINFHFGSGTPNPIIPHGRFSIRLMGQITAQFSEIYTFYTRADDGVRLIINGQTVVDDFSNHLARTRQGSIALQAGILNDITVEYYENGAPPASLQLLWSSPSTPRQIVPPPAFSEGLSGLSAPTNLAANPVSDTQVTLTWDDVPDETGFTVETSSDGVNFTKAATVGAGTTSLDIGGLTPSTLYYYRVTATNHIGSSAPSNVASATTLAAIPAYASLTTVYGLTDHIFSIDTTTGAATQLDSVLFNTFAGGRDPMSGNFYYISTDPSNVQIAKWDPTLAPGSANTLVNNSVAVTGVVRRAAFRSDGTLFFTANVGDFYSYNTTNNVATALGTLKAGGVDLVGNNGDMAFGPDGNLYVEAEDSVYVVTAAAINAANGSDIPATFIGTTGTGVLQIAFGQNGVLFGYDQNGQIYSIDLTTGAATVIPGSSPSTLLAIGDLASVPLFADLSVTQSAPGLIAGANGTYIVTVANGGPDATTRPILVTDTLPAGLSFISAAGNGWTFNVSGQTVTMIYAGHVAASTTLPSVTLTVAVDAAVSDNVSNTITVGTSIFDQNTSNNASTLVTTPIKPVFT